MEIRLSITKERLEQFTWEDYIALENLGDEKVSLGQLRDIIATFVANDDGTFMEPDQAKVLLGKLKLTDIKGVVQQLREKLTEYAAPKQNGSVS